MRPGGSGADELPRLAARPRAGTEARLPWAYSPDFFASASRWAFEIVSTTR